MDRENSGEFGDFEKLLAQIESHGLKSLSGDQAMDFGRLYRRVAAALSTARTHGIDESRIRYLNGLAARAYGHIYVAEPKRGPSIRRFFSTDFPRAFRASMPFFLTAVIVTVVAALFAYGVVMGDPGKAETVMGPGALEMMEQIADRHTGNQDWAPAEERPGISSSVMTNNIMVSALAFSTGIIGAFPTILVLLYNGVMLGVVAAAVAMRPHEVSLSLWSFVAPHGVIELTAIFISAAAGLMLGWALISTSEHTRVTALKLAAREAFKLMLGVIVMLVIAGVIEGFFSPSMVPNGLKLFVAACLGIAEFSYLFLAGREPQPSETDGARVRRETTSVPHA